MSSPTASTRVAARFLYGLLHGDTTLAAAPGGIWEEHLPEGQNAYPGVVFRWLSGVDVYVVDSTAPPIAVDCQYAVEAIDHGADYTVVEPLADRIYAVLQNASGTASGGQVFMCYRTAPLQRAPIESGEEFRHLGGIYRIYAR